jgi:hypothetical protein
MVTTVRTTLEKVCPLLVLAAAFAAAAGGTTAKDGNGAAARLFHTSDQCLACHNGLTGPAGEDLSIGTDWGGSMMANSARDPYWQGSVRREVMDHPGVREAIEGECSICHMPMARARAHAGGAEGRVFAHLPAGGGTARMDLLAADGVSCTLCHQIREEGLGEPESFVGGFSIDTITPWGERRIFGPHDVDEGRKRIMRSSASFEQERTVHMQESGLCGTCHTLYTTAYGPGGEEVGRLAEQMPFLEWKHSSYPETESCQDCHMREFESKVDITSVWGRPRSGFNPHVFRGGNFLVLRMLNRWRDELGTEASPQELASSAARTAAHLESDSARVMVVETRVDGGVLEATVQVENLTGHKLPSAYPSRRAWIHLVVRDAADDVVFESGAIREDGSICGNDNDEDASLHEPHHELITSPDQVQIYEPILGDPQDEVTTGLLTATHYLKDNRLLPDGFDKATAHPDVAVYGAARTDDDFLGGADRVRYSVALGGAVGPFTVAAALYYQPIGFRWAMNLAPYDAPEPRRFVDYYTEAAHASSVVLATGSAVAQVPAAPP